MGADEIKRLPDKRCVICNQTIDDVGGRRIVAQKFRGIFLSDRPIGGGNLEFPVKSIKLYKYEEIYITYQGEFWCDDSVERAKQSFLNGLRPWFCQKCGKYSCTECGEPITYPMGSDVLFDDGCSSHIPIHPFDPGCINSNCKKYNKEMSEWFDKS